jgi:ferredoxin
MNKVHLQPLNETALVRDGEFLLQALLGKNVKVLMSCGGNGVCSTCHVRIRQGGEQLSPVQVKERRTLGLVADADETSRLACQTQVYGDGVIVDLPAALYIDKSDDLLALLGSRAPENILHPIRGHVLIPKGKIITRTVLEQSRTLDAEVRQMKDGLLGKREAEAALQPRTFTASGSGKAPEAPAAAVTSTPQSVSARVESAAPPTQAPSYVKSTVKVSPPTDALHGKANPTESSSMKSSAAYRPLTTTLQTRPASSTALSTAGGEPIGDDHGGAARTRIAVAGDASHEQSVQRPEYRTPLVDSARAAIQAPETGWIASAAVGPGRCSARCIRL